MSYELPPRKTSLEFIIELTHQALGGNTLPEQLADATVSIIAQSLSSLFARHPVSGLLTGAGGVRVGVMEHSRTWSEQTGIDVFYVEVDLMNLGGVNAAVGASKANQLFIKPAVETLLGELNELTQEEDCWFEAWHHGGDEISFLVAGVSERQLTEALDRAVRMVYFACKEQGLAYIPHPKHLWNFSKWGAGLSYGIAALSGAKLSEVFTKADTRLEEYKRGLAQLPGASRRTRELRGAELLPDPRKISWSDRVVMTRVLLGRILKGLLPF